MSIVTITQFAQNGDSESNLEKEFQEFLQLKKSSKAIIVVAKSTATTAFLSHGSNDLWIFDSDASDHIFW